MRKLHVFVAGLSLLLAACSDDRYPVYEVRPDKRIERFDACMKALPPGPQSTHYNDWDEVIWQCDNIAYYQSKVCIRNCPVKETPREQQK